MENLRQAALTLHKLGDADRRWLMRQLLPEQKHLLSGLLTELQDLGVTPFDAETTLSELPPAAPSRDPGNARLNACSAYAVFSALLEEPDTVAASILNASPWKWRDDVLAEFDKIGRKERIQKAMSATVVSPKFLHAMVMQLAREVMPYESSYETQVKKRELESWLGRLKNRMGSWLQ